MLLALLLSLSVVSLAQAGGRLVEKPIQWSSETLKSASATPIVDPPNRSAGYFKLDRTHGIDLVHMIRCMADSLASTSHFSHTDAHMFYFLFQSRSDAENDPVVLWMTGVCFLAPSLRYKHSTLPHSLIYILLLILLLTLWLLSHIRWARMLI
jgi:hypothetical protein